MSLSGTVSSPGRVAQTDVHRRGKDLCHLVQLQHVFSRRRRCRLLCPHSLSSLSALLFSPLPCPISAAHSSTTTANTGHGRPLCPPKTGLPLTPSPWPNASPLSKPNAILMATGRVLVPRFLRIESVRLGMSTVSLSLVRILQVAREMVSAGRPAALRITNRSMACP